MSSSPTARRYLARKGQRKAIDQVIARMDSTPAAFDLTIVGNGFFVVRDARKHRLYATQAPHFVIDESGYILIASGARLQGRIGPALADEGDLQISAAGLPPGSVPSSMMLCYAIDDRGRIIVHLADGASYVCGQIMLQNFSDPQALVDEGDQLYSNLSCAGPLAQAAAPGSDGLGTIDAGVLELSAAADASWKN